MRYKISIPVFLAGLLVFALTVNASPQNAAGKRNPRMRIAVRVLKKAGCPLTDAQKEQFKNIERGPDAREQFMSILTTEQKEALENARKNTRRGKRRGPGIGKILQDAGYPLTDAQVEQLKNLGRGSSRKEQVALILTGEQKTALENHFAPGDREENVLQKPAAQNEQPETFNVLKQNYPNPFNPATTIDYQLAKAGNVTVGIYGPNGQLVSTLTNDFQNAGWHSVTWDASAHAGGIYVCRITSGDFTESRKMTYIK